MEMRPPALSTGRSRPGVVSELTTGPGDFRDPRVCALMVAMTEDAEDLEAIDLAAAPAPTHWPQGWYADPWTAGQYRYWNGQTWTGATHRWGPSNLPPAG